LRFTAADDVMRPMGRATSGVTGMRFRGDDEVLAMAVIRAGEEHAGQYVFTATDGGYAKRTPVDQYRSTGRGGLGVKAMKLVDQRGVLVGAVVVRAGDEVMAIRSSGQVTRSAVAGLPVKSRDTMGVKFVDVASGDQVVAIARNDEKYVADDIAAADVSIEDGPDVGPDDGADVGPGDAVAGPGAGVDEVDEVGDDEVTGAGTAPLDGLAGDDGQESE
jgi:DNA gyrase subunit A